MTPTRQKKAIKTVTETPLFNSVPQDELEDELERWVDYTVRATHKADDMLAVIGITTWIPQTQQDRRLGDCSQHTEKSCSVFVSCVTCRSCEAARVKFASDVGVCVQNPCPAALAALASRCPTGVPPMFCVFTLCLFSDFLTAVSHTAGPSPQALGVVLDFHSTTSTTSHPL